MRVAFVTPELHRTGGTERGAAELVARLAKEHHVCLFANQWQPDGTPNMCYHHVPVVPWPGLARFLSFYVAATRAVARAATRHGSLDVVYSPGPNCAQVEVCTAWFCQARQHELLSSGRLRPRPAGLEDWLRLAHRRAYAAAITGLERRFYRSPRLRGVVSPAEILKRDLVECYGMQPDRIVVGHSGVDLDTFNAERRNALRFSARRELGLLEHEFWFLFVGTDWVRKGLLTVFEALRELPEARLLVVGPYDPESYRRHSVRLGVAGRVRYLPRRADILYYYSAADALVAPSVYEPFGLIPLEAMACGVPAVITRQMGVSELVTADDAVILDDAFSADELASAMHWLMTDPNLRERLATNGLHRARANSWDHMCDVTLALLLETARSKGRNGSDS